MHYQCILLRNTQQHPQRLQGLPVYPYSAQATSHQNWPSLPSPEGSWAQFPAYLKAELTDCGLWPRPSHSQAKFCLLIMYITDQYHLLTDDRRPLNYHIVLVLLYYTSVMLYVFSSGMVCLTAGEIRLKPSILRLHSRRGYDHGTTRGESTSINPSCFDVTKVGRLLSQSQSQK